jgi:hypothetical protein
MRKPFAIGTGALSELVVVCAQEGFDLLVAADRPEFRQRPIDSAAYAYRAHPADRLD